jgi:hypothetical protein
VFRVGEDTDFADEITLFNDKAALLFPNEAANSCSGSCAGQSTIPAIKRCPPGWSNGQA